MKKLITVFVAAILLITSAAAYGGDEITVTLDGEALEFDVPPQLIDDFTFVPMRTIFESLGADVSWDGTTQTVTSEKNGTVIMMTIGYKLMFINYSPVTLEAPPRIIDGRTLVPVRAVAESFDCDVRWDGDEHTVIITSEEEAPVSTEKPAVEHEKNFSIEYDDSAERQSSNAKDFEITSLSKKTDGNYDITYTLRTYQDNTGDLLVKFSCLDSNERVVDSFSGLFFNWAYCWTKQEGRAAISAETVKIILNEN